jgi:hypothetical protein
MTVGRLAREAAVLGLTARSTPPATHGVVPATTKIQAPLSETAPNGIVTRRPLLRCSASWFRLLQFSSSIGGVILTRLNAPPAS